MNRRLSVSENTQSDSGKAGVPHSFFGELENTAGLFLSKKPFISVSAKILKNPFTMQEACQLKRHSTKIRS